MRAIPKGTIFADSDVDIGRYHPRTMRQHFHLSGNKSRRTNDDKWQEEWWKWRKTLVDSAERAKNKYENSVFLKAGIQRKAEGNTFDSWWIGKLGPFQPVPRIHSVNTWAGFCSVAVRAFCCYQWHGQREGGREREDISLKAEICKTIMTQLGASATTIHFRFKCQFYGTKIATLNTRGGWER